MRYLVGRGGRGSGIRGTGGGGRGTGGGGLKGFSGSGGAGGTEIVNENVDFLSLPKLSRIGCHNKLNPRYFTQMFKFQRVRLKVTLLASQTRFLNVFQIKFIVSTTINILKSLRLFILYILKKHIKDSKHCSHGPGTPVTGLQNIQLYPKSEALSHSSSVRI